MKVKLDYDKMTIIPESIDESIALNTWAEAYLADPVKTELCIQLMEEHESALRLQ